MWDIMLLRNTLSLIVGASSLAAMCLFSLDAKAGALDACGDIFVEAGANCEVLVEGGCKAECEPPAFTAVCAAEGTVSCEGECNVDADVECAASCQGSCEAECNVDPATFDCHGTCEGNCSADCSARCDGSADRAECEGSCQATCSGECDASCTLEPGQADCTAQCMGSCSGECRADINMNCQVDCQSDLYVECKADFQGSCEVQCENPSGAIFCDGQFIETSNIDTCVDALRDLLNANVEVHAEASGSASLSCAVEDEPARGGAAMLGFGLLCLAGLARRRA
jgi:MYXO-CTERM domain-containing protein